MKITKCIIPIAGKGTRFLPITKTIPKEMLPIVDKPTILLQVKEAYLSGINEIFFIVGEHNKDIVRNFFTKNHELEDFLSNEPSKLELLKDVDEIIDKVKFHYLLQDEKMRGTGGAIYQARDYFKENEYFAIIFGDDIIDADVPVIKQMINEHEKYHTNIVGVKNVSLNDVPKYGIVKLDKDNNITEFVEKPNIDKAPSTLASTGRYILNSEVFSHIKSIPKRANNEYVLVDTIKLLSTKTKAYTYEGTYFDIGSKAGYLKANLNYGIKSDSIKEEILNYIDEIRK